MSSAYAVEANEISLIANLAEFLEENLKDAQLNSGQIHQKDEWCTPQVHKYFLPEQYAPNYAGLPPPRFGQVNNAGGNAPDIIAYYPAVVLRPVSGNDEIDTDAYQSYSEVKVEIAILVSQEILTERVEFAMLITKKIRTALNNLMSGILGNQYMLQPAMDWQVDDNSASPQFVVVLNTTWRYNRPPAKSILNNME